MRTWNDKLRTVTESLLTVVTELHKTRENALSIPLVNSISDITQLLSQLNADHLALETAVRRERQQSENILARVEALERMYRALETERSIEPEQRSREASVTSRERLDDCAVPNDAGGPEGSVRGSQNFAETRDDGDEAKAVSRPGTPPRAAPPSLKATISPYRPPSLKDLPALPTLEEIQAEQRLRRSRKRALAARQPPPCGKCRIRKRAMMLRLHGYVKEDVFMRWSKRPGACLQFMHYDEPVAEGVGSQLSFPDTETQSPKE